MIQLIAVEKTMARVREIWFARRQFVGYVPVHWKGSALILAFFVVFFASGIGAMLLGLIPKYGEWFAAGIVCFVWLPFFWVMIGHTDTR